MARILVVDDDADFRGGLAETLADLGHAPTDVASGEAALDRLAAETSFDLVFLDLRMRGGLDGLETLRRLRAEGLAAEGLPVIMLTAHADGDNTIEAMKLGAFDHLTKPIGRDEVIAVLARALERPRASGKTAATPAAASSAAGEEDRLIGASAGMREVHKLIGLAANRDATVLITGETGTGKEEVARALHRHGPRAGRPFVAVNCAAIPAELLESELFGHVRGAFTGAVAPREGRFREADGGTLFLDEIGDMTLPMQAKMLRALQERVVLPVGASAPVRVNVRVVAATHRDLIAAVREGRFREDLFYRLNVVRVTLPPLRERGSDILVLAEHFLARLAPTAPKRLTPDAARALLAHSWPGNVRELRNLMERATVTVRGLTLGREDLPFENAAAVATAEENGLERLLGLEYHAAIAQLEQMLLERALHAAGGNRAEAARRLGIHRQLFYAKMREHGVG